MAPLVFTPPPTLPVRHISGRVHQDGNVVERYDDGLLMPSVLAVAPWHLAAQPAAQQRLRRETELMPAAVEEVLRAFSPVAIARLATADVTVGGGLIAKRRPRVAVAVVGQP